ncbi:MAG TPA: PilN domain-containing protein [Candidatus Saccharimonadales bacterium]|nr:PilN domain-containing protein [Candidatus Saccharimonadales bacterium]
MINLLSPEDKRQLRASRSNSLLLRYNIFLLGALVFLGLAIGVTYVYLTSAKTNAEQLINENEAKASSYASVAAKAERLKGNLATAKQILDKEVTYSKAILAIAKLVPNGVVLQSLDLDSQTFGTPTTLIAEAKSVEAAINLKNSFQNSSLFSNVHFESIASGGNDNVEYPVTVSLNVTISKDAAK